MTPAEILRAAATLIEKNGKAIGVFKSGNPLLAYAAMAVSEGLELDIYPQAATILVEYLRTQKVYETVGYWSDSHTAAEVVAGLRDAAKWSEQHDRS